MYNAGWAWAGSTPYKGTKLLASHLGGTRNPMAVRWPAEIKPDATPRPQFHHCNALVPTIYEVIAYHSAASSDLKAAIDGLQGRLMLLAFVPPKASDTANFASLQAWTLGGQGILLPEAELHETFDSDQDGRITQPRTAEAIPTAILAGEHGRKNRPFSVGGFYYEDGLG
jgi:arylsulfatase A-like enzyme